ncbi:unnamed protein product [Orchesella dallaii]|uniref:C883-1060-like ketoreductase domain-containing protein n=1 Tax=Orchesella dallaii TaxID=48710 RepID=A0ABP1Q196_9HEXA
MGGGGEPQIWVTYALTNDDVPKALTLCSSLRRVLTSRKIGVIVSRKLSNPLKECLHQAFDFYFPLEEERNKAGVKDVDFVKLYALTLKPFGKCVVLSPCMLALNNCDNIFDDYNIPSAHSFVLGGGDLSVFLVRPCLKSFWALMSGVKGACNGNGMSVTKYLRDWTKNQKEGGNGGDFKRLPEEKYNLALNSLKIKAPEGDITNVSIVNLIGVGEKEDPEKCGLFSKMILQYRKLIFDETVAPLLQTTETTLTGIPVDLACSELWEQNQFQQWSREPIAIQTSAMPQLWEETWKGELGPWAGRVELSKIKGKWNELNLIPDDCNTPPPKIAGLFSQVEHLVYLHMVRSLQELGWTPVLGEVFGEEELGDTLQIRGFYRQYFGFILEVLEMERILERVGDKWKVKRMPYTLEESGKLLSSAEWSSELISRYNTAPLLTKRKCEDINMNEELEIETRLKVKFEQCTNRQVITVLPATHFEVETGENIAKIRFGVEDDFVALLTHLQKENLSLEGIIYCWPLSSLCSQEEVLRPYFYLTKSLLTTTSGKIPKLICVTKGLLPVNGDVLSNLSSANFHTSTLLGFTKSLKNENQELGVKVVDVEGSSLSSADEIFWEVWSWDKEIMLAYRGGNRIYPKLQAVKATTNSLKLPHASDRFQLILPESRSISELQFGTLDEFLLKENESRNQLQSSRYGSISLFFRCTILHNSFHRFRFRCPNLFTFFRGNDRLLISLTITLSTLAASSVVDTPAPSSSSVPASSDESSSVSSCAGCSTTSEILLVETDHRSVPDSILGLWNVGDT